LYQQGSHLLVEWNADASAASPLPSSPMEESNGATLSLSCVAGDALSEPSTQQEPAWQV